MIIKRTQCQYTISPGLTRGMLTMVSLTLRWGCDSSLTRGPWKYLPSGKIPGKSGVDTSMHGESGFRST